MRRGPPHSTPPRESQRSAALTNLRQAVAHLNAGRWADAQADAAKVLRLQPGDPSALNVLGVVAMNAGRLREAIALFERAAAGQQKNPFIQYNLGEAHRRMGALDAAAAAFTRAARLKPDFAEAFAAAGDALRRLGRIGDAEASYQEALRIAPSSVAALKGFGVLRLNRGEPAGAAELFAAGLRDVPQSDPARAALLANIGLAWLQLGRGLDGLNVLAQAVEAAPQDAEGWRRLATELRYTRVAPATPGFRAVLLQLFERPDVNPRNLATAAIAVLRHDSEINRLLTSITAAPRKIARTMECEAAAVTRLLHDPLFRRLLVCAPVPDMAIELLLVQLRSDFLDHADAESELQEQDVGLAVALARQAFLNEYVLFAGADELSRVDALIDALDREDLGALGRDAAQVAIVAAYRPLSATPLSARLQRLALSPLVDILCEQLTEPAEETELRAVIPVLKLPTDATSLAVQQQYEQNPFPRWTRCNQGNPLIFRAAVQSALPDLLVRDIPDLERPRILVAGCGTGLEILRVANTYRGATILAVDLSAASLGYAMRKTREYGLAHVEYVQADILDLSALGEHFNLITSFGVLHHMADPAKGLQVLSSLLKPDGFLFVGLYSEIGRRAVVAARDHIGRSGYRDDAEGIRALRRGLMLDGAPPGLESVTSPASDFWTLSDCRDLLFHVKEHRFTLPQIGDLLSSAGLEFLGLRFGNTSDEIRYRAENSCSEALRDLQALHRHELARPEVFGDTYRLWARPRRASE